MVFRPPAIRVVVFRIPACASALPWLDLGSVIISIIAIPAEAGIHAFGFYGCRCRIKSGTGFSPE
jgi:hypothetical protein